MSRQAWSLVDDDGESEPEADADSIARVCLDQYAKLGAKGAKPVVRADGRHEWTILAGIVLRQCGTSERETGDTADAYTCISLATGVKALPYCNLSPHGDVLHDCHAEVLARRAARAWLLDRLRRETEDARESISSDCVFYKGTSGLYELAPGCSFHLYCSTLACGDLSSSYILAHRSADDDDARCFRAERLAALQGDEILRGRMLLEAQGTHLRSKPGRQDAPVSLSMSCSDKIVKWTLLGFQGALLSRCLAPLRFSTYVVGGDAFSLDELSASGRKVLAAQYAAIFANKAGTEGRLPRVVIVDQGFPASREQVQRRLLLARPDAAIAGHPDTLDLVPSAGAITWRRDGKVNSICDGRKQGASAKRGSDGLLPAASRSPLCKLEWFRSFLAATDRLSLSAVAPTYYEAKHSESLAYARLKLQLRGHNPAHARCADVSDATAARHFIARYRHDSARQVMDGLSLDTSEEDAPCADGDSKDACLSNELQNMPLRGWLVTGADLQSFDPQGKLVT